MAEHALIDRYLGQLEHEVRWIRDAEEIIEEVADHLLEAVATHLQRGLDLMAAQTQALTEFGDPTLVGSTFASSTTGGIAVPTQFTYRAGHALITSSVLWLVGMGFIYWSATIAGPFDGTPRQLFITGALSLLAAGVMLVTGFAGINRRHGGALGLAGRVAFWMAVVTAITAYGSWFWGPWLTALGIGAVSLAVALNKSDIAPRAAGRLVGLGGAIAAGSGWAFQLTANEVQLGEGAFTAFIFAGLVIYAAGLSSLGLWLKSEEPADQPDTMATA